jgi:radical SAM superfamily enzyme YgiQ (UPF0313 family)
LSYLIAVLRASQLTFASVDADIESLSADSVIQRVAALQPTGVVVLLMYRNLRAGLALVRQLKCLPNPPRIVGCGYAATLSAPPLIESEPDLDALVAGEAEQTILEIAQAWQNSIDWENIPGIIVRSIDNHPIHTAPRPLIQPLDTLPFPARDYLPRSLESTPIAEVITSRGCYAQCSFCNIPLLQADGPGPRWRGRSSENVAAELAQLYEQHGVRQIEFADENFIGPGRTGRARAQAIADRIRAHRLPLTFHLYCRADDIEESLFRSLKAAGLRVVNFGLESANQRLLDRFNKRTTLAVNERAIAVLHHLGLRPVPSFIMFEPTTTLAELRINLEFLCQHRLPALINPTTIIPFQGAPLTRLLAAEGLLARDRFILPPYIGDVNFADKRVAEVKARWEDWQKKVDTCYDQLLTILSRAHHAALDPESQSADKWQVLLGCFNRLKRLEAIVINSFITALDQSVSKPELTVERNSFLANLHQQTFAVLSEQPLIARRLGVKL